jgi:hypothetical protein
MAWRFLLPFEAVMAHNATRRLIRSLAAVSLAAAVLGMSGCGWLAGAYERTNGRFVAGEYKGLADQPTAIVVYVPDALLSEYTQAEAEISEYVKTNLIQTVPSVRLVTPAQVIAWQTEEPKWKSLSQAEVAEHFHVSRIIWIEVVVYRTKESGVEGLVRGRISTNVRVTETVDEKTVRVGWEKQVDVDWPTDGPRDMMRLTETKARQHTLELYGKTLANVFGDHREFDPTLPERRDSVGGS